jgi:hypothetical protein
VKQVRGSGSGDLLHRPGEPAGVEERGAQALRLAGDLLHLPGKPAGVGHPPQNP